MENQEIDKKQLINGNNPLHILIIEPFYGGSHKVLVDSLLKNFKENTFISLPAKKWHWRARCSALVLYNKIPTITTEKVLFCSSVLNLAELIGIRNDLQTLKKIVYFHENQLIYPVQKLKERDIQYAYNQIMTCLAADVVLFNSHFNKNSFIENINKVLKLLPDHRPKGIQDTILQKAQVLYFPVHFPDRLNSTKSDSILHIVWPHRWEFDKGPEEFFQVLLKLKMNNVKFRVSILGEIFSEVPHIFNSARNEIAEEIIHFGFVETKEEYYSILRSSHVVVSTALHEFFGVSVLEATYCGCFPLVPNRLVYPEIYPKQCLYNDTTALYDRLEEFCLSPGSAALKWDSLNINFDYYSERNLMPMFENIMKL